ncbi:IS630 family transposase, partial [Chloroflexus sp.]|uniref:IS630 family transposase n=1 Tax=Chloroflexus sp. TaxID=1904827 RepID=UPI00404987D8
LVHELGFALRVPRPQHRKRDAQAQVEVKKRFQEVEAARQEGRRGTLLADDEHRLGRKPVSRRVWRRTGERPTAVVTHRSRWCSVCTVVEPTTGWNLRRVVDGIDTQVMHWVVKELTTTRAEGEEAWVVVDRAGWHGSPRVEVPEGVRLICLPPSSPEVQPAERVWPVVTEAVANRYVQDLAEMMEVVAERCRVL